MRPSRGDGHYEPPSRSLYRATYSPTIVSHDQCLADRAADSPVARYAAGSWDMRRQAIQSEPAGRSATGTQHRTGRDELQRSAARAVGVHESP